MIILRYKESHNCPVMRRALTDCSRESDIRVNETVVKDISSVDLGMSWHIDQIRSPFTKDSLQKDKSLQNRTSTSTNKTMACFNWISTGLFSKEIINTHLETEPKDDHHYCYRSYHVDQSVLSLSLAPVSLSCIFAWDNHVSSYTRPPEISSKIFETS